ncbi:MAG: hypothetical protein QOK14_274, partial [Frankiaceae bacterium]|nr:hypothetical protein [Frankiaceae bacterium]
MSVFRRRIALRVAVLVASVSTVAGLLPAIAASPASAAAGPASIAFSTQPGDGDPGSPLAAQPVVTIKNGDGTTDTAATSTVTLTLNAVALKGSYVKGTLSLCTSTTTKGVATFTGCAVSAPGKYTLTATDDSDGLSFTSNPFYVSGPAQLVFTTQPGGGGAAASWSTQPVVTVEDAKGQPVADTHEVGLAIQGGTGPAGATLSCDTDGTAVNVVHFGASPVGQAAYAHCAIDKSGSGYSLYAVDPTDHLLSAPSSTFGITAGSVTQVVFGTEPAGATGGSPLPSQPVVRLEDAGGNVVTTATDHVTLAITPTSGTAGAQLGCTALDVTATNGIATFAGCAIDKAGTGYTLTATDSTAVATAISTPFAITTGEASAIAFTTAPSGGTPGGPLGTQPVVAVTDAGGNPVSGAVTLSIASGTGPSGAVLTCATNPLGTSGAAATFSGCSIDQSGTYRLTATAGAHSVTSAGFTVHSGTAADVSFAEQPASTGSTGGATFATQPTVNVTDAGGQPAQGSVRLAIADGSGTPGAVLTCASNPVATVDATATFSGCSVDKAGNGYRLVATLVGTTAATTSTAFDVVVGAAAKLAFTSAPASGTGGIAAATQPVVTVEDAGGNPVSTATGTVTLTRTAGTGSGSLSCQDNIVALQLGRALFSGCSLDGVAAAYTLTATWQSLTAVSRPFAVTAGPATHLVVTHQPVGAAAGAAFATQPAVAFEDAGGNVTTTGAAPVTLSLTAGTGASGATLSSCGASTNGGTTTFSGCAISATGNGYTLTASGGGLTTETLPLAITATAPAVGTTPVGGLPVGETFGGQVYGANPTDIVDHVNTSTGSLTFSSTDLRVAGIGLPFLLARTYNSADRTGGSFGPGWSSLFDIGVTMVPGKTATVRGEDGQQLVWTWNTKTRSWVPPVGARGSLDCGGVGNHCRYTRTDGSMWDVNVTAPGGGQLQTYRAADGNGLTFDWSPGHVAVTVTSTSHKSYTVNATTNARGEVTSVTTPAGTTVRFGYDGAGELTSVTDAAGRTWTYAYTGGLLTRQSDGDGALRLAASYDTAGRVTTVSAKGAAQHTDDAFSYSAGVTTRRAHVVVGGALADAVYTYTYVGNSLVAQTEPSGATTRYAYDSRGNLVTVLDPLGWAQTMTYDADNDMTSQRTPVSTVTMTYDRDHRPLTTVDASGATTTDVYDGPFLAAIISPGPSRTPSVTWLKYNDLGELVLVIGPMGRQSFGYDAFGNRTSSHLQTLGGTALDGPGTLTTFDEAGDRLSATDADGNKTVWTYDHAGDKLTQRSPTGATTSYGYSGGGDLAQVSTGGQTTTYGWDEGTLTRTTTVGGHPTTEVYDPSGNLLRQLAGGATTTNAYDANGQLVMTTDASGVTTRYSYDLGGNAVLVTSSAGDVMSKQYDAVHRAVRQVLDGAVTLTSYDAAGHVVATTDASGRTTTSTYGPMGAVAAVTTTAGTTRYGYDADGNVTSVTDPNNHATTSSYDAANRLTASSVGGNTTRYGYDFAGNVTSIIDPDGRRTTYTLDALARPTTTTYSGTGGGYTVTQAYDALGRRTQMTDPSGTHTFTYDSAGDLTSAVHGSDTFSYDYSTAGKIAETYPDGTPVTYTLDDAGNVMDVTSGQQGAAGYVQASYVRNAQRFTTALAYSNGVLETRQLTQSGQVLDQQLSVGGTAAADDRFAYNSGGERVSQVDNVAGQVTTNRYGYDGAGRLTGYSSATTTNAALSWPTVSLTATVPTASGPGVTPPLAPSTPVTPVTGTAPTAYTYDGNGNQLRAASGATYGYDAVDQLVSAAGPAGTTTSKYDHNGDLVSVTGPNGTETFTYDASGHLVGVRLPTGSTIAYAYDGDGNRISKTVGGVTTQYVWDPANASPQLAIER